MVLRSYVVHLKRVDGDALDDTVDRARRRRRIRGVADLDGGEERDRLGNHYVRKSEVCLRKRSVGRAEREGLTFELGLPFLLDCDGVGSDLVACDLIQNIEVVLARVGIVVDKVEDKGLAVDEGLRSMAIAHGGVEGGSDKAVGELEDLELALACLACEGAGAEVGDAVEVRVDPLLDLRLAGDDLASHGCDLCDPGALVLARSRIEDEGRHELHAGVGAGHGEALVIGARDEERQVLVVIRELLGKVALPCAGDVEGEDVVHDLASTLDSSKTLWRVAGTGEGDKDRRVFGTQVVERRCHDIGRSDCIEAEGGAVAMAAQVRRHRIADVGRGASTGEDNMRALVRAAEDTCALHKGLDGIDVVVENLERAFPEVGLLADFTRRDLGTH